MKKRRKKRETEANSTVGLKPVNLVKVRLKFKLSLAGRVNRTCSIISLSNYKAQLQLLFCFNSRRAEVEFPPQNNPPSTFFFVSFTSVELRSRKTEDVKDKRVEKN